MLMLDGLRADAVESGQMPNLVRLQKGEWHAGYGCAWTLSGFVNNGVKLEGSEKLPFENGVEFAATVWVRLPTTQTGDSVIFANKDWQNGNNPGIVLTSFRKRDGAIKPGVGFNAKIDGNPARIDLGTYHFEPGKWEFYAVTRDNERTLSFYQGSSDGRLYRICGRAEKLVLRALPFCLGQDGTGNYDHLLDGEIDDFALWTRALDSCEIKRIYEAGRKGLELAVIL